MTINKVKKRIMHVAVALEMPKETKQKPYNTNVNGALAEMEKLSNIKELGESYFIFKLAQAVGIKTLPSNVSLTIKNLTA